jgi:hypothetical protein
MSALESIARSVPPRLIKAVLVRVVLLVLFAGSVMLAWWSVNRLGTMGRETMALTGEVMQLTSEVEELERLWSPEDAREIEARFTAAFEDLFESDEVLRSWETGLRKEAGALSLEARAQFGEPHEEEMPGRSLRVQPAVLNIYPGPENSGLVYQQLLALSRELTNPAQQVGLMELTVEGESNSVSSARALLWLWFTEAQ